MLYLFIALQLADTATPRYALRAGIDNEHVNSNRAKLFQGAFAQPVGVSWDYYGNPFPARPAFATRAAL